MKLDTEFRKLPLRFDAERLAAEVALFDAADWRSSPQGPASNTILPLIAAHGNPDSDSVKGPMRPTPLLDRCPYLRQVLAALNTVLGRTQLVRSPGGVETITHADASYYALQRVRVHVPVVTCPDVAVVCGGRSLHLAAGECWIIDTWRPHTVLNPTSADRIDLVADTVGSASFWDLAAGAERPFLDEPELIPESINFPLVMSPWEQESLIVRILEDVLQLGQAPAETVSGLEALLERFHRQWRALWACFADTAPGWPAFDQLRNQLDGQLSAFAERLPLPNGLDTVTALRQAVLRPALNLDLASSLPSGGRVESAAVEVALQQAAVPVDGSATLRSVHTASLAELLDGLGISLLVTTYQAGKLIVVRNDHGRVNTHFRSFPMPMGLALDGDRLALGTKYHLWYLRNQRAVAAKLSPAGRHDACFLPRSSHFTGDISVHELAFADDGLWVVNTRFSCLCTLDADHSFVPRWRPPFVTALAPEDRCHLNGLAVREGRPAHVTCLGRTDSAGGWRANKSNGGLLLDVPDGEELVSGLSMPHSPRWYDGQLWVLESGHGRLSRVDLARGRTEPVATLPGFTRGLDFYGPYAFVGLSQVRETAVFSGIPITERLQERTCGVWVIDVRTGATAAFLRFEAGVQEIFAVQVLPGIRFPDVATEDEDILGSSFVLPEEALSLVPPEAVARSAP